jgi:hypothetical protein
VQDFRRRWRRRSGSRGRRGRHESVDIPTLSSARVEFGQRDDQGADAGGDRGSTGPDGLGGPASCDERSVPAQNRGRVTSIPRRGRTGSSRLRGNCRKARSVQLIRGGVRRLQHCQLVAQDAGSRSPWWCRIWCAAPSRPVAWRTSDRSVAGSPADHAGLPPVTKRQVNGCEHSFGHPHPQRARCPADFGGE